MLTWTFNFWRFQYSLSYLGQADAFGKKIELERARVEDLVKQIVQTHETILSLKREMKGVNSLNEHNQHIQKQIRTLENKLDKALVKLNEALTHNKGLRETIENLRRERQVFDGIYKKLEQELQDKKREMAQVGLSSFRLCCL